MSLTTCKECRQMVSGSAAACPHCGYKIKMSSGKAGCLIIFAAVGLFIVLPAMLNSSGSSGSSSGAAPEKKQNPLPATLNWDRAYIYVKNETCADASITRCTLYINGLPGWDSYKAEVDFPAIGNTVQIILSQFVKKDGTIFDPNRTAVTEAWVGGSGYDYSKWTK